MLLFGLNKNFDFQSIEEGYVMADEIFDLTRQRWEDLATKLKDEGLKGVWEAELVTYPDVQINYLDRVFPAIFVWLLTSGKATTANEAQKLLENEGLTNIAYFCPLSGNGVISNENGMATHVVRLWNSDEVESAEGVHIGMLMQGVGDIITFPAGNYPYKNAMKLMKDNYHTV